MKKVSRSQYLNIGDLESMNKIKSLISTPLLVFIVITLVGFMSIVIMGEKFWLSKIYAALDVASAVALAVLAFMVYFKYGKQLQSISIFIEKNNKKSELPVKILRKNFTRSEFFGILRALDTGSEFKIAYLSEKIFYKDLENVQNGKKDSLVIQLEVSDKFEPKL